MVQSELKKQTTAEEELAGATFILEDSNGNMISTETSNSSGIAEFDNLRVGNYTVSEIPLLGDIYQPRHSVGFNHTFELSDSTDVNSLRIDLKGIISVLKTDTSGNPLSGATFELLNSTGNVVLNSVETAKDGTADFSNLNYGTYKVEETAAPNGYILNTTPQSVTLSLGNTQPSETTFKDVLMTGTIEVVKTDTSGNPLAGAAFALLDSGEILSRALFQIIRASHPGQNEVAREADPTKGAGGGDVPVCIKDYANGDNVIARVDPVFTEHKFNSVPVRIIIDKEGKVKQFTFSARFRSGKSHHRRPGAMEVQAPSPRRAAG